MAFTVAKFGGTSLSSLRLMRDELLIILGTSSSETVLPRLLAKLQAAGASRRVTGVVIPTGYSFNLDGTCVYLTLGALFMVQAAGQNMPLATQIGLLALMVLTSKGAAGITGAGLVTLTASLQAFGGQWQGELDEETFHEALRHPSEVERATDRALAGAEPTGRFRRAEQPEPAVSPS